MIADVVGRSMAVQLRRVNGDDDDPASSDDVRLQDLLDEVRAELTQVQRQLAQMAERATYFENIANGHLSPSLPPPGDRPYLTVAEVKAKCSVSTATVARWCQSGKIRARLVKPPVGVAYWEIETNQSYPAKHSRKKG